MWGRYWIPYRLPFWENSAYFCQSVWFPGSILNLRVGSVSSQKGLDPLISEVRVYREMEGSQKEGTIKSENPKRRLKRQQPWNDAKSHAPRWVADSSFHGCWLGLFVVWWLLWVPNCCLSMMVGWRSRYFTAVAGLGTQEIELEHSRVVVSWLL